MRTNFKRIISVLTIIAIIIATYSGNTVLQKKVSLTVMAEETVAATSDETIIYQDGIKLDGGTYDSQKDIKKIYISEDKQTIFDYANGYSVSLPKNLAPNYKFARYVCRYESDELVAVISVEDVVWPDFETDINDRHKTVISESYQYHNNVTFEEVCRNKELSNGYILDLFRACHTGLKDNFLATYSYVYLRPSINSKTYYRFLLKYSSDYDYESLEKMITDSFSCITVSGRTCNNADYDYPVIPNYWNDETKAYYKYLCGTDICQWGTYWHQNYAGLERQHFFEQQTDSRADIVHYFISMPNLEYDVNFAQRAYEEDKVVMLSLLYTDNTGFGTYYPFKILNGEYDDQLVALAEQIKDSRHPVIIRVHTEYNLNGSVAGVCYSLGDTDWYRDTWVYIYELFRSRGVDNAIFMSNEQSYSNVYNEWNWCHSVLSLPSKEYMQIVGITAYDFGRDHTVGGPFSWMYTGVETNNMEFFSEWPWMMGEFGCANENSGINKAEWIKEMFATVDCFPNIKGAVWFDSSDAYADGSLSNDMRLTSPINAGITFYEYIKLAKEKSSVGEWNFNRVEEWK